jgi:multidrug efflux pump subunit AcrA (membrane-fusion protein)
VLARNPELLRSQAEVRRAERQLELERLRRQPEVALKVADERDRELRDTRLGVVVSVPIWDRRQGPVAEAAALLSRSRSEEASQQLVLLQALEGAYREYEIARTQVNALENGILREAEATMKVAEAAYRFGERGILEYLDAQRVFRAARNELIAARYALQLAVIEIERLRAPNDPDPSHEAHSQDPALALAMLTATLVLAGCKDASSPAGKPPADEVSTALDAGAKAEPDPLLVSVAADFGADIKVAPAGARSVSDTLRVAGKVDFDEYRVSRIGATVTGRVIEINVRLGQQVKVGDALAVINSTELGQAQLDYLKARAQADLQARSVERARQLFAADVIGRAELQRRESELAIASAEQRAAADQLRVLGMSQAAISRLGNNGAINSVTPVVSTVAGTVVERRITQGQVVQPADALYVVADLSEVWVTAEVPEQQAALVRTGQAVDIEVPALARGSPASSSTWPTRSIRRPARSRCAAGWTTPGGSSSRRCWRRC